MNKPDKSASEPSFPPPFEVFNEELDPHIANLQNAYQELEHNKNKWEKVIKNLEQITIFHTSYKNLESLERGLMQNIKDLEGQVEKLEARTIGYMEGILKENDVEPEQAKQVMTILDEKIHPEKYENKSPEEEKEIGRKNSITIENPYQDKEPNEAREIRDNIKENIPVDTDYYFYLLEKNKIKLGQNKVKEEKQMNDEKLNPKTPNPGYLNYQINVQKPVYKTPDDKNIDKRKDDKTQEME
ncbi:hypothetical protein [Emticicia fluvialis]|uniref:hypothetical protein n=1 Tax=Emticicia fluvialis TaxID=2974474 RepID=UPI0021662148|nr:hypothetical protein [Emticicia fluvialis]